MPPRALTVLFLLAAPEAVLSSGLDCFVDIAYQVDELQLSSDIVYGAAYDVQTKSNQTLTLDAYFPPQSDQRTARPAAVLVHGGSFEGGSKTSDDEPELAKQLVSRGYVAVSINYRLTGSYYGLESERPPLDAVEDAKAAVRYVRKMADQWRIDVDRIAVMGDSAGAVTSLYYGYVKDARGPGGSGNPGYDSSVQAAVSVSGELRPVAFCKSISPEPSGCSVNGTFDKTTDLDGSKGQPPLLMVHGTADYTVPYVYGKAVSEQASKVGLLNKLITIPGAGHVPFPQLFADSNYLAEFMGFLVKAMNLSSAQCPVPSL